jgi:hypothetical protein
MNSIEKIIADITSGDSQKVWSASCEIISLGQDAEKIKPLIAFLPLIKEKTKGVEMCGLFAPNQRLEILQSEQLNSIETAKPVHVNTKTHIMYS